MYKRTMKNRKKEKCSQKKIFPRLIASMVSILQKAQLVSLNSTTDFTNRVLKSILDILKDNFFSPALGCFHDHFELII